MARKGTVIFLSLVGIFILGTIIVLTTTQMYLRIDDAAYITEEELALRPSSNSTLNNRIPKILHQTWKTEELPEKWQQPSQHCRDIMPEYEYKLWTDAESRQLIAEHYPWFLSTFDGYKYNIQRADVIRYFVLHRYGGIYLDLDIGCIKPLDPLLHFDVILPRTKPVGVSNDLMFAAKGHPFMELSIRNLIKFDYNWILNYPTVMFSTGPMFISAQYGLYNSAHPPTAEHPGGEVRILPKSLYGKNAKPGEAPHSFFEHYYGSSWHSDDARLWTFLGTWGMRLMYFVIVLLFLASIRLAWTRRRSGSSSRRRLMLGRYEVVLPRLYYDRGMVRLDLGPFSLPLSPSTSNSAPTTPSIEENEQHLPLLPMTFELNPASPTLSSSSTSEHGSQVADAFRRAGTWVVNVPSMFRRSPLDKDGDFDVGSSRGKKRRSRGIMFFLPAIFTPSSAPHSEETISLSRPRSRSPSPYRRDSHLMPISHNEVVPSPTDVGITSVRSTSRRTSFDDSYSRKNSHSSSPPPPPYASSRSGQSSLSERR